MSCNSYFREYVLLQREKQVKIVLEFTHVVVVTSSIIGGEEGGSDKLTSKKMLYALYCV
jgi:hypothetical protein